MSRISPLKPETANGPAAELYKNIQSQLGSVPNIFQALGNTPAVLQAYFTMGASAASLTASEKEAIALAVAQANSCNYCLGAHTAIAKKIGMSEAETLAIRSGKPTDAKLSSLVRVAREIVSERGHISDESVKSFKAAGYQDSQLSEVVMVVVQNIFTNYFNHVNNTEVDFPAAQKLG